MNYYNEIKNNLIKCEVYDRVKDYAKDQNKVKVYFENGRLLHEAGREYGKNIIKNYADKLMLEVGKKYNERTLYRMRKFYEVFSQEKLTPVVSKLSWSHYLQLLSLKDINEIKYYLNECQNKNLSKRELQTIIKNHQYERLSDEVKEKLKENKNIEIIELVPNPITIKSNIIDENITEYALKEQILIHLDEFLKELGDGYCYIGNEYKIKVGNNYNYIDLLLFNYIYNSFVVIELKVTELKKEHIGQIEFYINYIDKNIKTINQDKTIEIILVKKNNKLVLEYSTDKRIYSRTYELV